MRCSNNFMNERNQQHFACVFSDSIISFLSFLSYQRRMLFTTRKDDNKLITLSRNAHITTSRRGSTAYSSAASIFSLAFKFQWTRHRHFSLFPSLVTLSSPFELAFHIQYYAEICVYDWEMSFTLWPSFISFESGYLHWSSTHRDAYIL